MIKNKKIEQEKEFKDLLETINFSTWLEIKIEILEEFKKWLKNNIDFIFNNRLEMIIENIQETENVDFKWKLKIIDENYNNYILDEKVFNDRKLVDAKFVKNDIWIDLQNEFSLIILEKRVQELNSIKEYKNELEDHKVQNEKKFSQLYWFIGFSVPVVLGFITLIWSSNLLITQKNSDSSNWGVQDYWPFTWQIITIISFVFLFITVFTILLLFSINWFKNKKERERHNKDSKNKTNFISKNIK
ncbi:hypothetical protein [Mycoplasma procyoni]|uniref:hypothetical protein n=1 Tax=Mycoplasma procyoni TaxID=568784 RepID=UPI00197B51EA|nr:hypothetical protein [Mycoplasma procyoni]MBN3534667.1 hypothetical protein [Mycoplasma procyoni]